MCLNSADDAQFSGILVTVMEQRSHLSPCRRADACKRSAKRSPLRLTRSSLGCDTREASSSCAISPSMGSCSRRAYRLIDESCKCFRDSWPVAGLRQLQSTYAYQSLQLSPTGTDRMPQSCCHALYACPARTLHCQATPVPAVRYSVPDMRSRQRQTCIRLNCTQVSTAYTADGGLATGRESDQDTIAAIVTGACPTFQAGGNSGHERG